MIYFKYYWFKVYSLIDLGESCLYKDLSFICCLLDFIKDFGLFKIDLSKLVFDYDKLKFI